MLFLHLFLEQFYLKIIIYIQSNISIPKFYIIHAFGVKIQCIFQVSGEIFSYKISAILNLKTLVIAEKYKKNCEKFHPQPATDMRTKFWVSALPLPHSKDSDTISQTNHSHHFHSKVKNTGQYRLCPCQKM